jgi:hypothetical protein
MITDPDTLFKLIITIILILLIAGIILLEKN